MVRSAWPTVIRSIVGFVFLLALSETTSVRVAILIAPLFLAGHIAMWARGTGMAWPALPNLVIDVLTIIAVITAVALVVQRIAVRSTRELSRPGDYVLPVVIAVPFATGFLATHPTLNPFPFETMLFVHVMSGNLVLVLLPITKLSHAVMRAFVR